MASSSNILRLIKMFSGSSWWRSSAQQWTIGSGRSTNPLPSPLWISLAWNILNWQQVIEPLLCTKHCTHHVCICACTCVCMSTYQIFQNSPCRGGNKFRLDKFFKNWQIVLAIDPTLPLSDSFVPNSVLIRLNDHVLSCVFCIEVSPVRCTTLALFHTMAAHECIAHALILEFSC